MPQPRVCFQTQTPLVRLLRDVPSGTRVEDLREEIDYLTSPGGVTRMLRALTLRLETKGRIAPPTWLSLALSPARLGWGRGKLEFVALAEDDMEAYASGKSAFWDDLHSTGPAADPESVARGLGLLGRTIGERSSALHSSEPFDLFYTHDFQLLDVAPHLPPGVPRVFRWHGPVRTMSAPMRDMTARALNEYDAVIVSTRGYAQALRSWGVRVPIHASYPYLDESRRVVTERDLDAFNEKHQIAADDVVFVLVARMDPIKSHDVAIRALARIHRGLPAARLVLVGGGGFSGGRQGLGLGGAAEWRANLEALARDLGVSERVTFTGGVADAELDVAMSRARAVLLPSAIEGFGLAAIEGWLNGKPAIVSRGAGVAELVKDGLNGYTFAPGDDATLAQAMLSLGRNEDAARLMGTEGRRAARACHLDRGADDVWSILRAAAQPERWERPARRRW